ncbi:MAG: metal ABC transporter ATP-binding protein [Nitrospirae bacterium]|nr:metal ABC transporter ATP-binding protein [Nitrospirota bacterium]
MDPVIEFSDVMAGYEGRPVFDRTTLRIPAGRFAGVVGPTGSGKSTLLKVMLGIVPPLEGTVSVLGRPLRGGRAAGRIGYVPQVETVDWSFPVTVEQVVMMGRYQEMGFWPWAAKKDRHIVTEILERLGIRPFAQRHIRDLSGGQQQRVFLARALVSNPKILILDEPTAGVDVKTQHNVLHLLGELNRDGVTIILTTHDLNAVAAHLPWVICFNQGLIAEGAPTEVFTPYVLRKTYQAEMEVIRHGDFILMANATPLDLGSKKGGV